jgi:hypothetical protein
MFPRVGEQTRGNFFGFGLPLGRARVGSLLSVPAARQAPRLDAVKNLRIGRPLDLGETKWGVRREKNYRATFGNSINFNSSLV